MQNSPRELLRLCYAARIPAFGLALHPARFKSEGWPEAYAASQVPAWPKASATPQVSAKINL
jgi:hypothetical protein